MAHKWHLARQALTEMKPHEQDFFTGEGRYPHSCMLHTAGRLLAFDAWEDENEFWSGR